MIAVAESARNVACVGARPTAITDGLNFANPEKPAGFWQFRRCVEELDVVVDDEQAKRHLLRSGPEQLVTKSIAGERLERAGHQRQRIAAARVHRTRRA